METSGTNGITGSDVRILHSVLRLLDAYDADRLELADLVNHVESHLWDLDELSEEDFSALLSAWGGLEAAYSIWLTAGGEISRDDIAEDVESSMRELRQHVTRILSSVAAETSDEATELDWPWMMCPYCKEAWSAAEERSVFVCPNCDEVLLPPADMPSRGSE